MSDTEKFKDIYLLSKVTNSVLIGVSGGKDSVATLDLCHAAGLKITGYFMYVVKGYRYQNEYLEYLQDRYRFKVHQYPHPDRVNLLREGRYCLAQEHLPKLTFRDVWEQARRDTGVQWIATGEKKRDSLERRAQLVSWGNVQPARRRGFPIAEWSNQDVFDYLERRKVKLSPDYEIMGHSMQGDISGESLTFLYDHFPEDYAKALKDFPLAEAARIRYLATGGDK